MVGTCRLGMPGAKTTCVAIDRLTYDTTFASLTRAEGCVGAHRG
ncbi:hypothetical protein OHB26_24650 [Nocardia sp. NBC_01503]|nr:hypothetical protein [Nocardia sp. NBC_01503]WTL30130.1 hypothetical protein OHB26_24650 [Nocardia sp. NBC_01503]